jgi:hypothetical protein
MMKRTSVPKVVLGEAEGVVAAHCSRQYQRGFGAVVAVTAHQAVFLLGSSMSMSRMMRCGGRTKLRSIPPSPIRANAPVGKAFESPLDSWLIRSALLNVVAVLVAGFMSMRASVAVQDTCGIAVVAQAGGNRLR